jgi:hypothetical protein
MIDEAPQEVGSPYATRSVQNAQPPCLGQGVHLLKTMTEAASRAAPLAEPAASHRGHATFLPKGESRENAKMTVKILLLE